MHFGQFVMPCHDHRENSTLSFERDLSYIQFLDSLGFDEVWVGEHHSGGWENIPSPEMFLAAAAQRTSRIRLGTGVVILPYHHPFQVAERIAFLDHLSHGRAILGVGGGGLPTDVRLMGIDRDTMRKMYDESLEIIMRLLRTDGPITYEGQFWTLREAELQVKSYQQPHVPVAITSVGGSDHSIHLATHYRLPYLVTDFRNGIDPVQMRDIWTKMDAAGKAQGYTPPRSDFSIVSYVYVAETRKQALQEIEHGVIRDLDQYFFHLGWRSAYEDYPGQPTSEMTIEQVVCKGRIVVGDPDDVIRWIKELDEVTGGFGTMLITAAQWSTTEQWRRSQELFARYVIPEFKRSNRGAKHAHQQLVANSLAGTLPPTAIHPQPTTAPRRKNGKG